MPQEFTMNKTKRFPRSTFLTWCPHAAAICVFALAGCGEYRLSHAATPPSARQIFEKYAQALDPNNVLEKRRAYRLTGRLEQPPGQLLGTIEIVATRNGKRLVRYHFKTLGTYGNGFDGRSGWDLNAEFGLRDLTKKELRRIRARAASFCDIRNPADYSLARLKGVSVFEESPCYELKLRRNSGLETIEYFDKLSGLLKGRHELTDGSARETWLFEKYREFDGVKFATLWRSQPGEENEAVIHVDSVVF